MAGVALTVDPVTGQPSIPVPMALPPSTVAATGSAIGNAAPIPAGSGFVSITGGNGTAGVQLPAPFAGRVIFVYATVGSQNVNVYPPVNGTVNNGSANAAVTLLPQQVQMFVGQNSNNWGAGLLS